jgi:hypothetical protein
MILFYFSNLQQHNNILSHVIPHKKTLISVNFHFFTTSLDSPVETHNDHLFPDFSKKWHGKTRHVMGSHGISRHFHGKVRTKGGLHWSKQYCMKNSRKGL